MNSKKYSFVIKDAAQFDYERVLRENPGAEALLITSALNAALVLSLEFVKKFAFGDNIRVLGDRLSAQWGLDFLKAVNEDRQVRLIAYSSNFVEKSRVRVMEKADIHISLKDLEEAREWLKRGKRKVTVAQV